MGRWTQRPKQWILCFAKSKEWMHHYWVCMIRMLFKSIVCKSEYIKYTIYVVSVIIWLLADRFQYISKRFRVRADPNPHFSPGSMVRAGLPRHVQKEWIIFRQSLINDKEEQGEIKLIADIKYLFDLIN